MSVITVSVQHMGQVPLVVTGRLGVGYAVANIGDIPYFLRSPDSISDLGEQLVRLGRTLAGELERQRQQAIIDTELVESESVIEQLIPPDAPIDCRGGPSTATYEREQARDAG